MSTSTGCGSVPPEAVFIELTDHLRCPAPHDEAYLVLLPERMEGRRVVAGLIGCPVCQAEFPVQDGVVHFGPAGDTTAPAPIAAAAIHPMLGLDGPGGFVALVGAVGPVASDLADLLPGVALVVVNPPAGFPADPRASIVRSPRFPLKRASMRGLVLPAADARDADWREAAIGAVLPGLRVVGQGEVPTAPGLVVLAEAGGWWVGRRTG